MSSEAITQNDLREILSRTVGSIPSEYKKLLWTNPSPTSAMSGGTTIVASGADKYDAIEVEYKSAHIYDGYETASAPFVSGAHITLFAPAGTTGEFSGANYNAVRTISMGAGGLLMADGAIGMTSSGTTSNNNMCIPYRVYGIQYERVNPPVIDDATVSNDVLSFGNLRVFRGTTNVPYSGWADIVYPTGTFSVVLAEIPYCVQGGFGASSTVSTSNAHLTDKAQVFQFNTAGASMQVGIITIGLA